MATGGSGPLFPDQTFRLPCGRTVKVSISDIFQTSASAVVTGESRTLPGDGEVAKRLLQKCPQEYRTARDQLKVKQNIGFQYCMVYSCSSGRGTALPAAADCSFDTVYHAIVPYAGENPDAAAERKWVEQMKKLYKNLFQQVEADGVTTLALPLLGSGLSGATLESAVEPLTHSLTTMSPVQSGVTALTEIFVHVFTQDAFTWIISSMEKDCEYLKPSAYQEARQNGLNGVLAYKMESTPRGLALIIDNEIFHQPELKNRDGTRRNLQKLSDLFAKTLGFKVKVVRDCTGQGMKDELQKFSQDKELALVDSCMVAVMSHGGEGDVVFGVDGKTVHGVPQPGTFIHTTDIRKPFSASNCPMMKGKPKLFLVHACRGGLLDTTDGPMKSSARDGQGFTDPVHTPDAADMYILYATVEDFVAYRHSFLEVLCKVFKDNARDRHVKDMATMLHNEMGRKTMKVSGEKYQLVNISEERGNLRKHWFFNPPP
ncbi:hypothetical protein BaRGS_00022704 [Batillaria attramentaria]|uniref:Uncharacterized protein n=1 Tax=Batillaria attramentaria TaxID=370345 RepID=A0ABD0KGI2_9CAEN